VGAGGRVVGSDFCLPMLERARPKTDAELTLADACALPFAGHSFDGVSVGWGIRNVPDIDLAHREAYRVLRSGGRFVSLDMAQPRNPLVRSVSRFLFRTAVPLLGRLFGARDAYTYLPESTERFHSREALADSMRRAGFAEVAWRDLHFGNLCIHTGRKP
ncbi:methyltransferase domain-containing protein, partial [bacterium]